jgi:hypothetical protein
VVLLNQSPYVVVSLMPGKRGTARTKYVNGGGESPNFDTTHANMLTLVPDRKRDTSLLVEVWNAHVFGDDLIGAVEIALDYPKLTHGRLKSMRFDLDTVGSVCVTLQLADHPQDAVTRKRQKLKSSTGVVNQKNVKLGMRVTRGPDWWSVTGAQHGDIEDIEEEELVGTLVAFRRKDTAQHVIRKHTKRLTKSKLLPIKKQLHAVVIWGLKEEEEVLVLHILIHYDMGAEGGGGGTPMRVQHEH